MQTTKKNLWKNEGHQPPEEEHKYGEKNVAPDNIAIQIKMNRTRLIGQIVFTIKALCSMV